MGRNIEAVDDWRARADVVVQRADDMEMRRKILVTLRGTPISDTWLDDLCTLFTIVIASGLPERCKLWDLDQ